MAHEHREPNVRVFSLADEVKGDLRKRLGFMVEAGAIILRDEVVRTINESEPAGRWYFIPGTKTKYQASAPGQPPAERLSHYVNSIKTTPATIEGNTVSAIAYTDLTVGDNNEHILGDILEHGTQDGRIAPRPHWRPAIKRALPKIRRMATRTLRKK